MAGNEYRIPSPRNTLVGSALAYRLPFKLLEPSRAKVKIHLSCLPPGRGRDRILVRKRPTDTKALLDIKKLNTLALQLYLRCSLIHQPSRIAFSIFPSIDRIIPNTTLHDILRNYHKILSPRVLYSPRN